MTTTTEPAPTLDYRFSEPGADATSWADTVALLETAELYWLTTVRADGRPHVTPVVAVWHDNAIYFTTAPIEQKMRNMEANPEVVVTTGVATWVKGLDVVVEGDVHVITDVEHLQRLTSVFDAKYDDDRGWNLEVTDIGEARVANHPAVVLRVVPTKVFAFAKDPHTQTRFKF
ncbi:pyridoxamine 5'-phosphate oxidase family protein [Actinokineospora pegani]|uniref:pyridoxamine 5'-phosphate oxidase family protein n=1 Tax=Actinokineospora pegani TaxID=2654637 RepID=UPI0012EAB4DB|nr:pyridoxamine 5'-phosphate oxidase family protein [Actinokineospora pegani]